MDGAYFAAGMVAREESFQDGEEIEADIGVGEDLVGVGGLR